MLRLSQQTTRYKHSKGSSKITCSLTLRNWSHNTCRDYGLHTLTAETRVKTYSCAFKSCPILSSVPAPSVGRVSVIPPRLHCDQSGDPEVDTRRIIMAAWHRCEWFPSGCSLLNVSPFLTADTRCHPNEVLIAFRVAFSNPQCHN